MITKEEIMSAYNIKEKKQYIMDYLETSIDYILMQNKEELVLGQTILINLDEILKANAIDEEFEPLLNAKYQTYIKQVLQKYVLEWNGTLNENGNIYFHMYD